MNRSTFTPAPGRGRMVRGGTNRKIPVMSIVTATHRIFITEFSGSKRYSLAGREHESRLARGRVLPKSNGASIRADTADRDWYFDHVATAPHS